MKRIGFWLIVALGTLLNSRGGLAQSFALNEASGNYSSPGTGVNIGGQNYYNSYLLKNVTAINPGMQPTIINAVATVSSGSTTTFTGSNVYSGYTSNQLAGGTWEKQCRANQVTAGIQNCGTLTSGSITSNTAYSSGSSDATFTVPTQGVAFAANDTVLIHGPHTPSTTCNDFNDFGWTCSGVTVDSTGGDLPPADPSGYNVVQVMKVTGTGSMQTNFDPTTNLQYYAFNGNYSVALNYKIVSGSSCPISYTVHRSATGGVNASGTISTIADGAWHINPTLATFTASEPNTIASNPGVQITFTGASGCVTLWFGSQVIRTSDTNPTVYRDQVVVRDFGTIKPAEARYWAGGVQNGETLDNWIATQNYRLQTTSSVGSVGSVDQGLYDFLDMAAKQGIKAVEIVVPITFDNTVVSNLVDFIAGGSGTAYGAKRIALGATAGFNTLIPRIVLEYGNEPWNFAAGSENITPYSSGCSASIGTCWNYSVIATSVATAMKANGNWDSAHMFVGAGMPSGGGSPAYYMQLTQGIDTGHKIDAFALNQYAVGNPNACTATNLYQTWWQQMWQSTHDSSDSQGWYQGTVQAATTGATVYPYEYQNNLTGSQSCTNAQIAGQAEGLGEGLADSIGILWDQQLRGTRDGTFFTLYQPNFGANNIWGITTGAGGAYQNPRASAYSIGLANTCAGGTTGYAATGSSIPTFNFSAINTLNSASNVPTIFAFPFLSGSTRCTVLYNMDPTTSRTVTLTGTNPPTGSVVETLLTSANVTDNNEGANAALVVQPAVSTVSNPSSFTVPAHSQMAVQWTAGSSSPVLAPLNLKVTIDQNLAIQ